MHERLVIIGAKGHGKVVADIAERSGKYQSIVFLDDDETLEESMGIPVVGKTSEIVRNASSSDVFVAIGNVEYRNYFMEKLEAIHAKIPVLIHPQAVLGANVIIGVGTVVMAGAVINPDVKIGKGCIINTCTSIDHDCAVGDYAHVAVGSHLAGTVTVGERTWIGAGAIVKNNVCICSDCVIGAGAVVVKNITKAGTYVGIPAKEMKMKQGKGDKILRGGNRHRFIRNFFSVPEFFYVDNVA